MEEKTKTKIKPKDKPHYVNNAQFSQAVVDYVTELNHARDSKVSQLPKVPDYIAMCFLKICEGLSHKANQMHLHTSHRFLGLHSYVE